MKCFSSLVLIFLAVPALASPDLGNYRDIEGVRVYRDHQRKDTWYLSPAPPQLNNGANGSPDYALDVYRYLGRLGTGDQGLFWVRGVLSLGITRGREPRVTGLIRRALRAEGVSRPRLRSMPVMGAEVRLMFADLSQTWKQGTRWAGQHLVLSLGRHMSEVLWDAIEVGQTLLSLVIEERLTGVKRVDAEWRDTEVVAVRTLPIELDMRAYPDHFRRFELGGRMIRGYTGLDVFCFDFLEGLDENLYAKVVEVAIPTTGRALVEKVTFRADSDYRFRIEFKLAKELDRPYRARVTRILKDGQSEVGAWEEKAGESLLDVTAYRESKENSDDGEQK